VSAFYTLNFTGCTTYTSRSGVKKEMRIAIPAMGSRGDQPSADPGGKIL